MTGEHLYSKDKIDEFANLMFEEFEKHKGEKSPLGNWDFVDVIELCKKELRNRLRLIRHEPKQTIHMANFLFLTWMKLEQHYNSKVQTK